MKRLFKVTNVTAMRLAEEAQRAEMAMNDAHSLLFAEQRKCGHKFVSNKPYDPTDRWFSSSGHCEKCGYEAATWWCPWSPDGLCDYNQGHGKGYNPDNCIWCHLPDERK